MGDGSIAQELVGRGQERGQARLPDPEIPGLLDFLRVECFSG